MKILNLNEGEEAMDHDEVVRQKVTERYLLAELDPDSRDRFEEHFFDCPECALDVQAGAQFVAATKVVLAQESEASLPVKIAARNAGGRGWFGWLNPAWLKPAFALPALAVLLCVIGYQNLVTYPKLRNASSQPQTLPWAAVAVGTWGSSNPTIALPAGSPFLLFVRIPPDGNYVRYIADLYDPAGRLECSLNILAVVGKDQWPVLVPGANREAGNYRIAVRGLTASGESKDLGGTSFTLEIEK
ncbi:MAG TPA: zf-HC2 domain-containing protein [Candidatus Dormibacteraeota bacterium]|nr:zf-HC2 domain-containing protein [Candidatus Dormibacteraeota bacterium]